MPKNKFQDVIYTIIMASVMVYGMVAYNIVLNTGSMQNWVFLAVFHEWPIMTVIAILPARYHSSVCTDRRRGCCCTGFHQAG